jgi:four helix bundle protein
MGAERAPRAKDGGRKIRTFRDLRVWQYGMAIARAVYSTTGRFPPDEKYGLAAQMRRAGVSIPSNVAEGFNRYHNADYRRFLYIALGSCAELETQTELSRDFGYISPENADKVLALLASESGMLRNLVRRINERQAKRVKGS